MRDFNHTVNVLVKAFLNDTLKHETCKACAVGNIVGSWKWRYLFVTCKENKIQHFYSDNDEHYEGFSTYEIKRMRDEAKEVIEKSGYTIEELARIENVFELSKGKDGGQRMFNGLMAVVDVLADIHGISLEAKEKSKLLFVKL